MRNLGFKSLVGAGVLALALSGQALAADMPVKAAPAPAAAAPDFDIAFGGGLMSDYIFRGITQSNHGPSATAYFEPHYKELYIGVAGSGIDFVSSCGTYCLNSPAAEVDLYGGWRPTVGKWSFDFGYIYYLYPKSLPASEGGFTSDFQELYAKATYAFTDAFSVGGAFYYSPDLLNYGKESEYYEINAKFVGPNIGAFGTYISGAYGHFDVEGGLTGFGFVIPSYNTWNVGGGFTWKALTLDLRYSDTDLNSSGCSNFWNTIPGGTGGWCRAAFAAKLSFDLLASALK